MSRANAGRKANDNYPTPLALARAIVAAVAPKVYTGKLLRVLEPSAGEKAHFVRALKECTLVGDITAIDLIDYSVANLAAGANRFVTSDCVELARAAAGADERFDLIIGNPPFTYAEEHIRALVPLLAPGGVLAFLLRLNFFGADSRWTDASEEIPNESGSARERVITPAFWPAFPEDETRVLIPRPMFKLNSSGKPGSDGTEYAVITWRSPVPIAGFGTVVPRRYRGDAIFWKPDPAERAAMVAEGVAAAAKLDTTAAVAQVVAAATGPRLDQFPQNPSPANLGDLSDI